MAQAIDSHTTRRSILLGAAAAIPAFAVPAIASPEPPLPASLGENLIAASDALCLAVQAIDAAEAQAAAWVAANPEPICGEVDDDFANSVEVRDDYHARLSAWVQARNAAWRSAGLAKSKVARERALMDRDAALNDVVDFPATTLPDLIAKTQLLRFDDPSNSLATSIAYGLFELDQS